MNRSDLPDIVIADQLHAHYINFHGRFHEAEFKVGGVLVSSILELAIAPTDAMRAAALRRSLLLFF